MSLPIKRVAASMKGMMLLLSNEALVIGLGLDDMYSSQVVNVSGLEKTNGILQEPVVNIDANKDTYSGDEMNMTNNLNLNVEEGDDLCEYFGSEDSNEYEVVSSLKLPYAYNFSFGFDVSGPHEEEEDEIVIV
ncbi:hypothetical protein H6P81_019072 [Aristolochia fimbriata]|uniref:Uncharacterized protein n=1 Tax=Aristolochia fimbriata TaxID=158543 RepID=A0AAV7E3R5_ARIFI|nr:hypothetical protein H6P81_019072 [Aristolochia fimbriata]